MVIPLRILLSIKMTTCNWFVLIEPQPHDTWWYKWYKSLWMCPNYAYRSSTDLLSLHLISQILKTFRPHAIHRVAVLASPWWLPLVLPLGPLPTLPRSLPPSRCSFHRHLSTRDEKGLIKTTRNFAGYVRCFWKETQDFWGSWLLYAFCRILWARLDEPLRIKYRHWTGVEGWLANVQNQKSSQNQNTDITTTTAGGINHYDGGWCPVFPPFVRVTRLKYIELRISCKYHI